MENEKKSEEEILKIGLSDIKCPICENSLNWVKPIGKYEFDHKVRLLAECWCLDNNNRHLFIIVLDDLPIINMECDKQESEE